MAAHRSSAASRWHCGSAFIHTRAADAATLPPVQANAGVLPIMLATRLLPEMEAEQEALLAQLAADGGAGASMEVDAGAAAAAAGATVGPLPTVRVELAAVQQEVEAWNARVAALEAVLPPRGSAARREAAGAAAAAAAPAAPAAAGTGAAGAAARLPGAPGLTAAAAPEELSGPDLLLAAASYGAGLA